MSAAHDNVLHVVDSLDVGGAQTILKGYFEARPDDPSIHLYSMRRVPGQIEVTHPNAHTSDSPGRYSWAPLADLRKIVRDRSIGIVHCHLFRAQVFGLLLRLLDSTGVRLVFHEHGRAVGRESESRLEESVYRWFLRGAWRRVDGFICISDHTREKLLELIPGAESRMTVVANPVPVRPRGGRAPDREAARRAQSIPDGAFVVGFASRLVERKGWSDFLDAIAIVAAELPVFFMLAGDGEDRAKAEARIRERGLPDRGRLLGQIDWMETFYACLDCFVMPSHWEPHGLTHLEAQGFGVPTVVSNVPGLRATVHGDADALLFEAGDVKTLAAQVKRVALDPALRERLSSGGRANSARFSMDAFASSLDEVYAALEGRR